MSLKQGPIGIFDSGYGGLTVLDKILDRLPEYDYLYLGDNARAPYGSRSFEVVYEFTRQAVKQLFSMGCPLIILACNTASAKALRTIQQKDLPELAPDRRVLGVIRPTVEALGSLTNSRHVGIVATTGTTLSRSYSLEINKFYPDIIVTEKACPLWVPLVENNEYDSPGADYFVRKYLDELLKEDPSIDTLVLGCTHYPLLIDKIRTFLPAHIQIISQGDYVANSLASYLIRHPEIERFCSKNKGRSFLSTESETKFEESASIFLHHPVQAKRIFLG